MTRSMYACVTNERFSTKIVGSDGETIYTITYDRYHVRRNNSIEWRWQCECRGYRQHRRSCKHIREAKKEFCGWREDKVYDPPLEIDYLDEKTQEALCPLCGKMAYPASSLKNLHDHESSYVGENNESPR
jgi:hypothetical protein